MSLFEDIPALSPVQFFGLSADCQFLRGALKPEKPRLLPSTHDLLEEECFCDVYAGWNFEKLSFYFAAHTPFERVNEADFRKGDSIELFIYTREQGVATRFSHHFVFFPVIVQNFYGREITRFRNDDSHKLCHPEDLNVDTDLDETSYRISVEIPAKCLFGFDPLSFPRLGFTYRINRSSGAPQHFAVSSEEYTIEQHPETWGTLRLLNNES